MCVETRRSGPITRRRYACRGCNVRAASVEALVNIYDAKDDEAYRANSRQAIESIKALLFPEGDAP